MQLKSLQIQGFKSFPDKTRLEFSEGITAVVGPNGSGKSNISDAVRWVLGEQSTKTLRGGKMEDVIFAGTQTRKATGFSSVELTIDNVLRQLPMECDEITISRKLYRSGDSEYRVNNTMVRLKDINELLMDTGLGRDGYSIIGQGKISEIVNAKNTQRREIFEEAAGISKFRYRKEEAEKRLEGAQENLLRLKDILTELEDRMQPLREQSQKASLFLELAEEKKILEISLWIDSINEFKAVIAAQEEKLLICRNDQEDNRVLLEDLEHNMQQLYHKMQQCSMDVEKARKEIASNEADNAQSEATIAVLNNDIFHNNTTITSLEQDIASRAGNNEQIEAQLQQKNETMQGKQQEIIELQQQTSALQAQLKQFSQNAKNAEQQIAQLREQRIGYEKGIAEQQLLQASSSSLQEETHQRLAIMESSEENRQSYLDNAKKELQDCKELLKSIEENIHSGTNARVGWQMKLSSRQQAMEGILAKQKAFLDEAQSTTQRAKLLLDMEKNMEGFGNSVKYIVNQGKQGMLRGIHGPISKLISTSEEHSTAIEIALGGALQNIVVEDEAGAKAAIYKLKAAGEGRVTFLPLTAIKGRTLGERGLEAEEGYIGIAAELVHYAPQYKQIVSNLLGKTVVVTDLDSGIPIAKKYGYRFRIVTLDGQQLNAGGSMTGGSVARKAGMLSRQAEIDRLNQKAALQTTKAQEMEPQIKLAQEALNHVSAEISALDAQLRTAQEDKLTYTAEQKRYQQNYEDAVQGKENARQEYENLRARLQSLNEQSASSEGVLGEMRRKLEEVSTQISAVKEERALQNSQEMELNRQLNENNLALLTLCKDIQSLEETSLQLKQMRDSQTQQTDVLQSKIQELQQQNLQITEQIAQTVALKAELQQKNEHCLAEISRLNKQREALEQQSTLLRGREKEMIVHREQISGQLARLEEKKIATQQEYDRIISCLWDEYNMTRTQAIPLAAELSDKPKAQRRLSELKNKIKGLGTVNLAAIEEYKEVSERYHFMKTQVEDVEQSRTQLIKMIRELTGQMREIFSESFSEINRHFGLTFQELFGGGKATLTLTEPDNVLESGIEIFVQPPGKIINNLSVLSGGEKSFVAIAIYFAILKVSPSPFVLLDEIEAALDDVNVTKFASYLRKLCSKTQFIAITHRRGTMEEADRLYGVTMQEEGVSKLLHLDVSEMETKLGIKSLSVS